MSDAQVDVLEAVGYGPDSEIVTDHIQLAATDVHSGVQSVMKRNLNGTPAYSCERWLRLRFTSASVQALLVRFWIDNLAANPGWQLLMGATDTYRKPTASRSDIAVTPVPGSDPGPDTPNLHPLVEGTTTLEDLLSGVVTQYSPWLVLQAVWSADNDDPFQSTELDFRFSWEESE